MSSTLMNTIVSYCHSDQATATRCLTLQVKRWGSARARQHPGLENATGAACHRSCLVVLLAISLAAEEPRTEDGVGPAGCGADAGVGPSRCGTLTVPSWGGRSRLLLDDDRVAYGDHSPGVGDR